MLTTFPTIEGKVTAKVHAYVAVNRNTSMKEEAFSFLELLCRDEVLCGLSFKAGEETKTCELPYILQNRIINQKALAMRYPSLTTENQESLEQMESRIGSVIFYSDVEQELRDMFYLYFQSYWKGEEIEIREALLSATYDVIEMKVLE